MRTTQHCAYYLRIRSAPDLMKIGALLVWLLFIAAEGRAQSVVDSFNPGANGGVFALAVQGSGKILVGGTFTMLGGGGTGTSIRNFIGRVNSDGTLDTTFDPGANDWVYALAVQGDDKILVGGIFHTLGGGGGGTTTRNNIGRLDPNGTLDASFDPGANNNVNVLVVQANGKILVGGDFTALGDGGTTTRNHIGRLNADGTLDTTFDPGTNGSVNALAVQADGKILVGGLFSTLGGGGTGTTIRNNIGRLNPNGTLDTSFNPGADSIVFTLALQADGKILAGGFFNALGGGTGTTIRHRIGRLNPNGTLDASFNPGANGTVEVLTVQPDNKILVGGVFSALGGGTGTTTRNNIGRLSPDGTLDTSFNPGANDVVEALAVQADRKILVGGFFTSLGGGTGTVTRNKIGRLGFTPPVIISPLTASATTGQQFVYQIVATQSPTSYSVSGLPSGFSFNGVTGVIFPNGMPMQPGTSQITLHATNPAGTGNATLVLTIKPAPSSGPIITSGTSETGRTGQPFSFQILASGTSPSARVSATGLPPGLTIDPLSGLISGTPTQDGSFGVTITVTDGSSIATRTLELTFTSDPGFPIITSPKAAAIAPGVPFTYKITAPNNAGPSDPTTFSIIGTLPAGLSFNAATGTISGTFTGLAARSFAQAFVIRPRLNDTPVIGGVDLLAHNSHGTGIQTLNFLPPAANPVLNISTRSRVLTGQNVLIGGFIIRGPDSKKVILRGIGPSLAAQLPGVLADPTLELHNGTGQLIYSNDNWKSTQQADIQATGIPPTNPLESAIVTTLAPGRFTAILRGKNATTGIGLVELYDLTTGITSKLVNISTRAFVDTGDSVIIGGFIVGPSGTGQNKVIIRAIGPSLSAAEISGALQDPILDLYDVHGVPIAHNDNWGDDPAQKAAIIASGIPPTNNLESAIVRTLTPGAYTAIVRGKNGSIGVGLVELYTLQ